jgi:uncharacterized protein (TIGR03435 family)
MMEAATMGGNSYRKAALMALFCASCTLAQPTASQSFDVAVVKKPSLTDGSSWNLLPSGEVRLQGVTISSLVHTALYRPGQLPPEGLPAWTEDERADIVAKAPPRTSNPDFAVMLANLLAERFKLSYHREQQQRSVYALVVARQGVKMNASPPDNFYGCDSRRSQDGMVQQECHHITMAVLSESLPNMDPHDIDRPVVDLTGLKGTYEFILEWNRWRANAKDESRVSLIDAIAKLGLKIESRKLPIDVTMIDHIERPAFDN